MTYPNQQLPLLNAEISENSTVYCGDAYQVLSTLPSNTYQSAITSPPYWGLRDYSSNGQIGSEVNVDDYIDKLVKVFHELRRVLKDDGTFWLNIGDTYTSGGRNWRAPDKKNPARAMSYRAPTPEGLKPKELIGVPWRVAFALSPMDGIYVRRLFGTKPILILKALKIVQPELMKRFFFSRKTKIITTIMKLFKRKE